MTTLTRVPGAAGISLQWSPGHPRAPTHTHTEALFFFLICGRKAELRGRAHAGTGEAGHSAENKLAVFFWILLLLQQRFLGLLVMQLWSFVQTEIAFPQNC